MIPHLTRSLLKVLPTLLIAWMLIFAAFQVIPGDPVNLMLDGTPASPEMRQNLRHNLGLDRPLPERFVLFLGKIVKGDLGVSYRTRQPVAEMIAAQLPATLQLTAGGLLFGATLGLMFGLIAGLRPNGVIDFACTVLVLGGASLPAFWSGMLLIWVFSIQLRWVPILGDGLSSLILPSITAGLFMLGGFARLTRASVIEVVGQDYIRTARAKGLAPRRIVTHHILRNALIPPVTLLGMQVATMIGGAMVTENIFARPGIGTLLIQSVLANDLPVVHAIVVYTTAAYILINILVDCIYYIIDPRIRLQRAA
jgi:peptide/nickel transport system permease protein/oligopeptide transport system permease protein